MVLLSVCSTGVRVAALAWKTLAVVHNQPLRVHILVGLLAKQRSRVEGVAWPLPSQVSRAKLDRMNAIMLVKLDGVGRKPMVHGPG